MDDADEELHQPGRRALVPLALVGTAVAIAALLVVTGDGSDDSDDSDSSDSSDSSDGSPSPAPARTTPLRVAPSSSLLAPAEIEVDPPPPLLAAARRLVRDTRLLSAP